MLKFAILADDLTGAADTTARFLPFVDRATLFVEEDPPLGWAKGESIEAWGIHTASRSLSPKEAFQRTESLGAKIMSFGPEILYKKIDSCLRGNVGAEVESLLEVSGKEMSLIAPAHPEMGRTTVNGIHLLKGVPICETEMGHDPISPVKSPAITDIIKATTHLPVAHLPLDEVRGGVSRVLESILSLRKKGMRLISLDAVDPRDLEVIAKAGLEVDALLAGSAGLATALARLGLFLRRESMWVPPTEARKRPWLMVLGSGSEVTRIQAKKFIAEFPSDCLSVSCPHGPSDSSLFVGDKQGGRHLLLVAGDVEVGAGNTEEKTPSLLTSMAVLATEAIRKIKPGGLFLTGGDTAQAVLSRLGARMVRLRKEIIPGVILGEIEDGFCAGTMVATKAGAFGTEDTLVEFFKLLDEENVRRTL